MTARPAPPGNLGVRMAPAPELLAWVARTFLDEESPLFNPEHIHLKEAEMGFLWSGTTMARKGRQVVGLAEMPSFNCHKWQRARQEQQIFDWFGAWPDFIITVDADFALTCNDATFCALLEHELYHCGQAQEFGAPVFKRDGTPKLTMRGHDVEEFVGVVERYGVAAAAGGVADLVKAAQKPPSIARVNIAHACGTCMLKLA